MEFYRKELRRNTQNYNTNVNKEYINDKNLWFYQSSGSRAVDYIKEENLLEAIREYENMKEWN